MSDLSPVSTDSRGLTNGQYGQGVLQIQADRKLARQAVELDGARHVVFATRPRGQEQTVFDEFAHLETLYFGSGGAGRDGSPAPGGGGSVALAVPGQVAEPEEETPHADEVREIRDEVAFVQHQYLSQDRAERHKYSKYYTEDEALEHAERAKAKKEVGCDAAFAFRQRLAMRVADAGMGAEDFRDGMELHGIPEDRAAEVSSLIDKTEKKVAYTKGKDGMFEKYSGTGIPPPNEIELRIIARVLDHAAMDKQRVKQMKVPGTAVNDYVSWYHQGDPIPEDEEQRNDDDDEDDDGLETLHMDTYGGHIKKRSTKGAKGKGKGKGAQVVPSPQGAAQKYVLEKKPPPRAETPPNANGANLVCAFCGKKASPVIDPRSTWHLQQYYDDETDRLVKDYFCENHNFSRILLKRPTVGTHVKTHLWQDLREATTLDRQHKHGRILCYRSLLIVALILNICAILIASFYLPLLAKTQRCALLGSTATHTFSFNVSELDELRVEATRGTVTARTRIGGGLTDQAMATATVLVQACDDRALSLVEVKASQPRSPSADASGAADAAADDDGSGGGGGLVVDRVGLISAVRVGAGDQGELLPITMDDCYRVDIEIIMPPSAINATAAASAMALSVHQRWNVSDCTINREQAPWWLTSLVPARVIPPCVISRRVPDDDHIGVSVDLNGTLLQSIDLSSNSPGAIVVESIVAIRNINIRSSGGVVGNKLRTPSLAVYSLGGDINIKSVDHPLAQLKGIDPSTAVAVPVRVWLHRGEGNRHTLDNGGAMYLRDSGTIHANLTGLLPVDNEVTVHGGDADVTVRLIESTAWSAALRSCGGQLIDTPERLEGPPSLGTLPLICQSFFDQRWEMCKLFAIEARERGDEHVTIDYAGNGFCEAELNFDPCYDGGDCCASTCNVRKYPMRCGMLMNETSGDLIPNKGYNCTDHWAPENFGPLPDCGTIMIALNELYAAQMAVWRRALLTWPDEEVVRGGGVTRGWQGGPRSKRPQNSGLPEAQMIPVPYTSVEGATKAWGWHTCTVGLTEIFLPQRTRTGADSPLYPRSQLNVDVTKGDITLELKEVVGYADAWRRHQQNIQHGIDCSIWNCDDEDECASSPCLNGATCAESDANNGDGLLDVADNSSDVDVAVGYYNCSCPWGYCGGDCEYAKEYQRYRLTVTAVGDDALWGPSPPPPVGQWPGPDATEYDWLPKQYFCMAEMWFQVEDTDGVESRLRGQALMAATSASVPSFRPNNTCQARPQDAPWQCLERFAFDGYASTAPCSADGSLPALMFIAFDTPMHLLSYSIQAPALPQDTMPYYGESGRGVHTAPTAWQLEAMDPVPLQDGGSGLWLPLDVQEGVQWQAEEYKTFGLRSC